MTTTDDLRRVLQTMTNDDTSVAGTEERDRFVERSNLLLSVLASIGAPAPQPLITGAEAITLDHVAEAFRHVWDGEQDDEDFYVEEIRSYLINTNPTCSDTIPRSELERMESIHRSEIAEMAERFRAVNVERVMEQLASSLPATTQGINGKATRNNSNPSNARCGDLVNNLHNARVKDVVGPDRLREAAKEVIACASDTYKKRNGHLASFEDDSGEKCWIVPFDPFESLRSAVAVTSEEQP